jgi:3-dehydroquinate synthase
LNILPTITYDQTPVHVGLAFDSVWNLVDERTIIITDSNVMAYWGHLLADRPTLVVPSGEDQKSLSNLEDMVFRLLAFGADRGSFLLGVGGGVICDLTGFLASVFMRGIPFAFVPTTLLAQVDASIGGKNGVNCGPFKNMVGTFNQPQFVLTDPQFLSTLPDMEFANGLAECIKHACICSAAYFDWIETNLEGILQRDRALLEVLILESVRIKCDIVSRDPLEKGERKLLNFGHTYGHAIEKLNGLAHGQAVSLGMVMANELALKRKMLDPSAEQRVIRLLDKAGLPTDTGLLDRERLLALVRNDKKKREDQIAFILLNSIGQAVIEKIVLHD